MKLLRTILSESEEPLLLYHGGPDKLTKLDPSKVKGGARATIGWGVYFSTSKYKAGDYGPVLTVIDGSKLHILDMRNPVTQEFVDAARKYADSLSDAGLNILYVYAVKQMVNIFEQHIGKEFNNARKEMLQTFRSDMEPAFLKMLGALGYDTVKEGYEYAIFDMDAGTNAIIQ